MPVPARRVPSGTIVVDPPGGDGSGRTVVYVRVSSHERRPDLEAQVGRVSTWCVGQGVREVLTSMCAGLYGRRGTRNRAMRAVTATKRDPAGEVPA